jgi:Ca-activated chloride channel family protein
MTHSASFRAAGLASCVWLLTSGTGVLPVRAQQEAVAPADMTVTVAAPEPDAYVVGNVPIKIRIDPPRRVREVARLMVYADGRLVCTILDMTRPECTWDAGPNINEHVIRVVAELFGGGRVVTSTRTRGLEHVEKSAIEVVQVTAVVNDRGRFIKGLPLTAFRVLEDGVPQKITHFSSEGSPLDLVIAVDVSESMTAAMPALKTSVKKFLAALGPKDQVTLTAFNDNLFTLTRRETTPEQRLRAVDRLAPWGGTALYDVIVRGLQQLAKQPGRRVLVVFSDGDDRSSHATLQSVEQAVRASDATLFMVALGGGVRNAALKSGIERLVDLSGGRALFVDRSDQLDGPFAEIIEELANQYLIGYESTNAKRDGAWREIKVELVGERYTVRARQGYNAPAQ